MGKTLLFVVFAISIGACYFLYKNLTTNEALVTVMGATPGERYYQIDDSKDDKPPLEFDLVDPECAPEAMLTKILYGYQIMLDTRDHTPEYAGNSIDCNCCHFNGGNTLGGKNRGISLVGVTAMYPKFSKRDNKNITLMDRLDNCYRRSLNGKPLPHDSLEMESLLSYLAWISHEVVNAPMLPWLGLEPIVSTHVPDAKVGDKVYYDHCALCHGNSGEGHIGVPPLWGDNSYNDGAGMNMLPMLAPFILLNMPHGQPILTPEEALDVAAFLISCPRPHFIKDPSPPVPETEKKEKI
ncbi:MAG: c-type cytochrome [Parachlamydiaceae bacterium]